MKIPSKPMMKKRILWLSALLVLLLSVCFSTFCAMSGIDVTWGMIARNFLYNTPGLLFMGCMDYFILYRLQPKDESSGLPIWNIVVAMLCTPLLLGASGYLLSAWLAFPYTFMRNILPAMLCNAIIVLLIGIYLYGKHQMESRQRLALMEREKTRYQFEALKNQINPHFLFNSLNVLASLAYQDADKTNLFVKKLAEVYRYLLTTHNRQTVSLEEELHFTEAYLYLEDIRFGEALQVSISGDRNMQSHHEVIPASLQMLVENAIKHNTAATKSPLIVRIAIKQDGITVSNNLQLRSYVGTKNGMGLANLRNQYALYGKELSIRKTETDFVVEMPFIQ